MKDQKNGLFPGWPPFSEFKKEMTSLVSFQVKEHTKPLKQDLETVRDSMLGMNDQIGGLKGKMNSMDNKLTRVENLLSNHITDTNKKIDIL